MFLFFVFLLSFFIVDASEIIVHYSQAFLPDLEPLVLLVKNIGTQDPDDLKKVVKLPEQFIPLSLEQDINLNKLFIATLGQKIVGFKKLFILNNQKESDEILANEIRCIGDAATLVDFSIILYNYNFLREPVYKKNVEFKKEESDLTVYTGADYVIPELRKKNIAKGLYAHSLSTVFSSINFALYKRLVLVYGLSQFNDFNEQSEGVSRTPYIVASVMLALSKLNLSINKEIQHYRFKSIMPQFIKNSQSLVLLPDEKGIPGFGNVLVFVLSKD